MKQNIQYIAVALAACVALVVGHVSAQPEPQPVLSDLQIPADLIDGALNHPMVAIGAVNRTMINAQQWIDQNAPGFDIADQMQRNVREALDGETARSLAMQHMAALSWVDPMGKGYAIYQITARDNGMWDYKMERFDIGSVGAHKLVGTGSFASSRLILNRDEVRRIMAETLAEAVNG